MLPRLLPRKRKETHSLPAISKKRSHKQSAKALIRLPSLKPKPVPSIIQQETADSDDNSTDSNNSSKPNTVILAKRPIVSTKHMKNARRLRRQSVISKIVHHMVTHSAEHQRIDGADVSCIN